MNAGMLTRPYVVFWVRHHPHDIACSVADRGDVIVCAIRICWVTHRLPIRCAIAERDLMLTFKLRKLILTSCHHAAFSVCNWT